MYARRIRRRVTLRPGGKGEMIIMICDYRDCLIRPNLKRYITMKYSCAIGRHTCVRYIITYLCVYA